MEIGQLLYLVAGRQPKKAGGLTRGEGLDLQPLAGMRMRQAKADREELQMGQPIEMAEKMVVVAVAVAGIAQDGVG